MSDNKNTPIPGATVQLFSSEPGPPLETLTETDGTFSFADLPAGLYKLVVEMAGFDKLTTENLKVGTEPSQSLKLVIKRPEPQKKPEPQRMPTQARRFPQQGEMPNTSPRAFQEIDMGELRGADGMQSTQTGTDTPATAAQSREDNSDLLVISGNSTANINAGDWNDPNFRERMMEMAGRMGIGGFMPMIGGGEGGTQGEGTGRPGGGMGGPPGGGPGGPGGMAGGGRFGGGGPGFIGGAGRGGRGRQSKLNGSVYSTYQNSFFNARNYSLTGTEVNKPLHIQNTFGVSLGGTLSWKPKQSQQTGARRFQQSGTWFATYEGGRNRNPYDILTTVPTGPERAGDFSQTALRTGASAGQIIDIYDPQSGGQTRFSGNRIPSSRISPIAAALMQYIPLPNLAGQVQNFTMQRGLPSTSDSLSGRVNTPLTPKDNIFFNYSLRRGESVTSQIFPGLDTERTNRAQNFGLGGMHRFQPRLIMNYRVSLNRVRTLSSNPFSFANDVEGQLGINGVSRDPINFGIPTISLANYGDLQVANPSLLRTQTTTIGAGINKIGKKHTISTGGDINWNQRNSQTDSDARGTFNFTGFATSAFNAQSKPIAGTGYDFADFLLGLPYSTSRRFGSSNNYLRARNFNLFVQDNWRVRSTLTASLGLRYEYVQPYYEKYNHLVSLDVAPGATAVAQVFPDQTGPYGGYFPRSLVYTDKNNLAPRVGIAWKRKSSSKWVFRAGYGMFYNPAVYSYIVGQLVGQPPFAVGQSILTTPERTLSLQNGFPSNPDVTILNTYAIDPHYRRGYIQNWNLTVQTQLLKVYTLEAGYNASKGTRLDTLRAPNRAPQGVSPGSTEGDRQIGNAGNFVYQTSEADSVMHSLRMRLVRRFAQGFRLENSYTFGKSIDNASGIGGGGLVVVQNEHDLRAERSLSSFDQRHNFQSNFSFELPVGERRKYLSGAGPALRQIVSHWTITGTYQLTSGTPLTPRLLGNVSNNSGTGANYSERPDSTGLAVALPSDVRTTSLYFNTGAFAIPIPGKFGNAARYTIPGPGSNLLNLTLSKSFRLDENNRRIDLRWQVTNLLNHPNYGGIGTAVNTNTFGRVTSVRSMRQMQVNFRINF